MSINCYIFVIFCIKSYFSFKIGTYNTHQAQTGGFESNLETFQVNAISSSDINIDVICLQELFNPAQALRYQTKLNPSYRYSFSGANSFNFSYKVPCSDEQLTLLSHSCVQSCAVWAYHDQQLLAYCLGTSCPEQLFPLLYTSCLNCIGACIVNPLLQCSDSIGSAMFVCGTTSLPPFDWIDGTVILSKYPIINTWSIDIPSWLSQRAISIAQIDVCSVTNSNSNMPATKRLLSSEEDDNDIDSDDIDSDDIDSDDSKVCHDTIIVGCLHLKDCDQNDQSTFFPTSEDQQELEIQSYVELNAYQSQYIMENILNPADAPWIHDNDDNDDNNVIAVLVAGDFNVGTLLYPDNFAIWKNNGFISGRDIRGVNHIDHKGTYNADPNSEFPNDLAYQFCLQNDCSTQDSDIDHVLVKTKKKHHRHRRGGTGNTYNVKGINGISYNTVFTELFDVNGDGNNIPLSDHWGIEFEFEFKNKKSN